MHAHACVRVCVCVFGVVGWGVLGWARLGRNGAEKGSATYI